MSAMVSLAFGLGNLRWPQWLAYRRPARPGCHGGYRDVRAKALLSSLAAPPWWRQVKRCAAVRARTGSRVSRCRGRVARRQAFQARRSPATRASTASDYAVSATAAAYHVATMAAAAKDESKAFRANISISSMAACLAGLRVANH